VEQNIPIARKTRPEHVHDIAKFVTLLLVEEGPERGAMVKKEYVVGATELLQQEGGRADLFRRVFYGRFGVVVALLCRRRGLVRGELGEVDGLLGIST